MSSLCESPPVHTLYTKWQVSNPAPPPLPILSSGCAISQGSKHDINEDFIIDCKISSDISLFGIVDGHGGVECAKFISQALPQHIISQHTSLCSVSNHTMEVWGSVLENAFASVAFEWDSHGALKSGAVCTLVVTCLKTKTMLIAHVGDCKVISSAGVELTRDHRCSDPDEVLRIQSFGGFVTNGRVYGKLMPSRTFGNLYIRLVAAASSGVSEEEGAIIFRESIRPEPELGYHRILPASFVVIASDGLFDAISPQTVVEQTNRSFDEGLGALETAHKLVDLVVNRTTDDVSVIVLRFE